MVRDGCRLGCRRRGRSDPVAARARPPVSPDACQGHQGQHGAQQCPQDGPGRCRIGYPRLEDHSAGGLRRRREVLLHRAGAALRAAADGCGPDRLRVPGAGLKQDLSLEQGGARASTPAGRRRRMPRGRRRTAMSHSYKKRGETTNMTTRRRIRAFLTLALAAAAALAVPAPPARADVTLGQKTSMSLGGINIDIDSMERTSADKQRNDSTVTCHGFLSLFCHDVAGGRIVRLDKQLEWELQPQKKLYSERPFPTAAARAAAQQ